MKPEELDQLIETLTGIRAGKPWQARITSGPNATWFTPDPSFTPVRAIELRYAIRLNWTLPPPPEGREWHRGAQFTEADLPEGYRPMLLHETACSGDEVWQRGKGPWVVAPTFGYPIYPEYAAYRTKRPLFEPAPAPAPDPYAELKAAHAAGKQIQYQSSGVWVYAPWPSWDAKPEFYRVKPAPVPLCKDNIPPNSVIRNLTVFPDSAWRNIEPLSDKVIFTNGAWISYPDLMREGWEILRPGQDWQPCSKEAPAP